MSGEHGKGKKEDPVKKFVELDEKVDKIVNKLHEEHSRAFLKASEKVLHDKEGNPDYDLLKKDEHRDKFVDEMVDHYLSSAKQVLGIKEKEGPSKKDLLKSDMLIHAVYNTASAQLKQAIHRTHEQGSSYTLQQHEGIRNQLMKAVNERLRDSAAGHLKKEHRKDLVKYAHGEEFIDHEKMSLDEAIDIARGYRIAGAISPKQYEARLFYKKKEEQGSGEHRSHH
ncbi:hypothetical protein HY488_02410 [Candidatus Woesearchaeota archaeon]|nr:hypothetical protein [Candidatus Woesearchaeota archaeon]